jgi:hypothetical protein
LLVLALMGLILCLPSNRREINFVFLPWILSVSAR